MFAYVWEYFIEERDRDLFLRFYGSEGVWVKFFRNGEGYIKTELLTDLENPQRFLTFDHWKSKTDRDLFRATHAREFNLIDKTCEALTRSEKLLGEFSSP